MNNTLLWVARLLGVCVAGFFAMFAVGSLRQSHLLHTLPHLLPALLVIAMVIAAWTHPALGAIGFATVAVGYGLWARRIDWFLVIGGPLLLVAGLHAINWRLRRRADPSLRSG